MHTVGSGIWRETLKKVKMRNACFSKTWKMRNAHCRNRNMARNLKIIENEKNTL